MRTFLKIFFAVVLIGGIHQLFAQRVAEQPDFESFKRHNSSLKSTLEQTPLLNNYDVKFYHLDVHVERTSVDIEGNVRILAAVTAAVLDTFAFELIDVLTVDSVVVNGINSTFTRSNNEVFVKVLPVVNQGNMIDVKIYYGGTPPSGGFFSGISSDVSPSWGNRVTWTLSEAFNANQWFPCKQVLADKADSVYVFITTSDENKAGSNGILYNTVTLPNNMVRYEWKSLYPINYYLISLSVGEYVDYSIYAHPAGLNDSILIQNYVYDNPQTLNYFKDDIDKTADFIELYSELYGLYPFWQEKYGHCMAPLGGGMEHQTMTTLGFFNFTLVSHELSHQWFGDNVTCATWSDIWVNEGFASYSEYIALEHLDPGEEGPWMRSAHNQIISEPGGSVYVPVNEAHDESRIFDSRLSYKKGAAIIHMLRFELQDDTVFYNIMKTFQQQYKDSIATGEDFKNLAETLSGKNLDDFFDQWYYGEGHPIFDIVWLLFNDSLYITSAQTPSTLSAGVFKMLLPFKIYRPGTDTLIYVQQDIATQTFALPYTGAIDSLVLDPDNWQLEVINNIVQGVQGQHNSEDGFLIYPNPVKNEMKLQFARSDMRQVYLYNSQGQIIENFKSDKVVLSVNTSDYPEGIYFVKVINGAGICCVRKIIKM